jgi:hypothetical protein
MIFTIDHSTHQIAEFLRQHVGVDLLVDVRSIPRWRTNPEFNADALPKRSVTGRIVLTARSIAAGHHHIQ